MKRIFITGAAGFAGSHIAEFYASKGVDVVAFDNLSRFELLKKRLGDTDYNWRLLSRYKNVELVKGDIRRFEEVRAATKNVDAIIHCAAQVAVTTSIEDPRTDFEINAFGTFNVLEAARLEDIAILYFSTNKVYGDNVNRIQISETETRYEFDDPRYDQGIPEDFPLDNTGHSPYGCSKLVGDLYVQEYGHTYALRSAVFRCSCIYGERQFGVEDQGFLAHFIISAVQRRPITIYGDGKQVRDMLYIEDLVRAVDIVLTSPEIGEVYNIGGGPKNTASLLEIIAQIEKASGSRISLNLADWRPMDQRVYMSDIRRIRERRGWQPQVSFVDGMKRLYTWVSNNAHLLRS